MREQWKILAILAYRNLFTHKVASLIVGSIIFFGTALVIVGLAMLESMETSMARSVTSSLAGHLQVYDDGARDDLALFGGGFMGADDVGQMDRFEKVREVAEKTPNVKAIVPMGLQMVTVAGGNEIDKVLEQLRAALDKKDEVAIEALALQVKGIAEDMQGAAINTLAISNDNARVQETINDLTRARSPEFWAELRKEPEPGLMFLETKVAARAEDSNLVYLRNLGTDPERFTAHFDRFNVVEGEMIPTGKRGFLFAKRVYERQIKNKVARELDTIKRERDNEGADIDTNSEQKDRVRRLPGQYRRITFQLKPEDGAVVEKELRAYLPDAKGDLQALVQALLTVNGANFDQRYAFFYEHIAPRIRLYEIPVGSTITLRSFTRSGYVKSLNLKVYGTYQFSGLEDSDLAGAQNLIDMVSFRDLYGTMTAAMRDELAGIKKEVGIGDVARDNAEDALFGDGGAEVAAGSTAGFDEFAEVELDGASRAKAEMEQTFGEAELNTGIALNAAVVLEDPSRLAETQQVLKDAFAAAGLKLRVVDWKTAAGIIGQFITLVRSVLIVAIFIIFLVALVIINNSMVMATMERVPEIGTMRAMGAQRGFVLKLFLGETLMLGLLAGSTGALGGWGLMAFLGKVGIPAVTDILTFLFSGPRLYPTVGPMPLLVGFVVVLFVSLLSTFYPAVIATRIQPVVAMQAKE